MFLEKYPEIQDETLNIFEISQLWHKIKTEHPQFNRK